MKENKPHGAGILKFNTGLEISVGFEKGEPKGKAWAIIKFQEVPGVTYSGEVNYQS